MPGASLEGLQRIQFFYYQRYDFHTKNIPFELIQSGSLASPSMGGAVVVEGTQTAVILLKKSSSRESHIPSLYSYSEAIYLSALLCAFIPGLYNLAIIHIRDMTS